MESIEIENTYQEVRSRRVPELPVSSSQSFDAGWVGPVKTGAVAGAVGAGVLATIMYGMWAANQGPKPMFLEAQQTQFGEHGAVDHVAGVARFASAGAVWGALFSALVKQPTPLKGAAFGVLPSLYVWTVIAKQKGEPLFFGFKPKNIIMPLVFNSAVWGTLLGKLARR